VQKDSTALYLIRFEPYYTGWSSPNAIEGKLQLLQSISIIEYCILL